MHGLLQNTITTWEYQIIIMTNYHIIIISPPYLLKQYYYVFSKCKIIMFVFTKQPFWLYQTNPTIFDIRLFTLLKSKKGPFLWSEISKASKQTNISSESFLMAIHFSYSSFRISNPIKQTNANRDACKPCLPLLSRIWKGLFSFCWYGVLEYLFQWQIEFLSRFSALTSEESIKKYIGWIFCNWS